MRVRERGENPAGYGLTSGTAPWARRDAIRLGAALSVTAGHRGEAVQSRMNWGREAHRSTVVSGVSDARGGARLDPMVIIDSTDVRALALRALDAAKAAGAGYADVHLTRALTQGISPGQIGTFREGAGFWSESESFGVGVRVRVGGAWGFASSPYWNPEEMIALAHEAVVEARANARGTLPAPDWAPIPVVQGHWAMPIKVDPFVLTIEERIDQMQTWAALAHRYPKCHGGWSLVQFWREERAVATSEGSYFTQTRYLSRAGLTMARSIDLKGEQLSASASARGLEQAAAGWELLTEADIPGQMPRLYEEADPRLYAPLPKKPGEVGRYNVVFDAWTAGQLLEQTLAVATQLDRTMGLEANASGTSYLGPDPLALLGSYQATSSLVTVTANRSMPRGAATVKWDAEGVEPEDFTLVKDGVLMDYQTTRALAPFLAPWYQKQGRPVRSHGCAWSGSARDIPMQHMPNIVLEPGKEDVGFEELVAATKKGLAVLRQPPTSAIKTDFQCRTGEGFGQEIREITNGKLGAVMTGLNFLFSSSTLWKNVVALGGKGSAVQYTADAGKGQPGQGVIYSLRAVPLQVKDVDFIDPKRKA